jgi:SAM-dependent methyltransferase
VFSFSKAAAAGPAVIDVRRLIAELSDESILASADAYFNGLTLDSEQCHKPFSNPADAPQIARNLGLLLEAANLFFGADVLDFGCATGWLTMGLARMGCNAIGIDISPTALDLARQMEPGRTVPGIGPAQFYAYDGQRLPLEDESIDRIVCFDAFHHVKDQAGTLREFARVLRPGGIIAMVEPGPHHSLTPQSQDEMRKYNVIENDVSMPSIAADAHAVGLDEPEMLVQLQRPLRLAATEFQRWSERGVPALPGEALLHSVATQLVTTQCFSISKGTVPPDSRQAEHLAAELKLLSAEPITLAGVPAVRVRLSVVNCGRALWRTGEGNAVGTVKVGIQLAGPYGDIINADYCRAALPATSVAPGEEIELPLTIGFPHEGRFGLRFDIVSEYVAWLGHTGKCAALFVGPDQLFRG